MSRERLSVLSVGDLPTTHSTGGTGRVALGLCTELARRGHSVTALAPWTPGAELIGEVNCGTGHVKINRFGNGLLKQLVGRQAMATFGACLTIRDLLTRGAVSVVLSHHPNTSIGAFWAMNTLNRQIPLVYMFYASHADEIRTGAHQYKRFSAGLARTLVKPVVQQLVVRLMSRAEEISLRRASRVVTLSLYAKDWAQRLYEVADDRFTVFPAGVDTQRFCPPQESVTHIRQRLDLPDTPFILFTLRNLHPRMGLEVLLQAMPGVLARVPNTLLIIGGQGTLFASLHQMIADLRLQDHVRLMGHINELDLPNYYQAADVFVLPTQAMEGFGMVTLEALACGTPVIGTQIGATPELLSQLGAEFLFDACDAAAFTAGILRLREELSKSGDGIRMQCRRLIETRYTWAASAERLERVLYEVACPVRQGL